MFLLEDMSADDNELDFWWAESSDPAETTYTIESDVKSASIPIYAIYDSLEVLGPDRMDGCMSSVTFLPDA